MTTAKTNLDGDGRVALITGGANGIGQGVVERFAAAGYRVAIADVDSEAGEALRETLESGGGEAIFHPTDVADEAQVAAAIQAAVEAWGTLDFVLNNAGIVGRGTWIEELETEDLDRVLAINLKGPFYVCKHAVKAMRASGGGSILNISSITATTGSAFYSAYGASKAGVISLTRGLARRLGRFNIRINCLRPGSVDGTDLMRDHYEGKDDTKLAEARGLKLKIPVARLGQPEDIANLALFLASPLARHIHGEVLTIDGGELLGFQ